MRQYKTLFIWAGIVVMGLAAYYLVTPSQPPIADVTFSEFLDEAESGALAGTEVEIRNENEFSWKDAKGGKKATGKLTDEVLRTLRQKGVKFRLVTEESNMLWQSAMYSWIPMIVLSGLAYFVIRQLQSGGGKAMSFGKSKARLVSENNLKITFKDVAGVQEAKVDLQEIVEFLKDPKKFTRLGGRIPRGVLLMGPPGTGKTLLARAIAGEAGVPFFSISGSDFVEMFVGVGASRVRDLFEQSKKHAPCIIFMDEIDAVGRHRGISVGGGGEEREQTLNQLLVEMDGFESTEGVILIAATNRPDVLDPALLRPGRFDRRIVVSLPDMMGRGEILKVHTRNVPLDTDVNLTYIARTSSGFSGADLSNLVNEAALAAARENKSKVSQADFETAKDKVLMGSERRSMILSEKDKRITAYHEAGHALLSILLSQTDPLHKVTIIPRGLALGVTQSRPEEDRYTQSRSYAYDQLCMLFGGRVAEEIEFGDFTSGAANDIEVATNLCYKMICKWGMSNALGPIAFGKKDDQMFLGYGGGGFYELSEQTKKDVESEVSVLMRSQYERAKSLISANWLALARIAEALIVYETLDGVEVKQLVDNEALTREPPKVRMTTREENDRQLELAQQDSANNGLLGTLPKEAEA